MKLIKSYIRAIKYVYSLATFKEENIPNLEFSDEYYTGLNNKDTIVRVFYSNKQSNQSIIIFPGASPFAEKHPGMMMLGSSLRDAGYNVYLPRIPALKNLILEKENIDWFAHCYKEIVHKKIQSKNNIMIIGLSYGGASLLRATLDERMLNPVPKSILSYGTYFSIDSALDFFISGKINYQNKEYNIKPHEWGLIVMFYNFIDTIETKYNKLKIKKLLQHRIKDEDQLMEECMAQLTDNEKKLVENILSGKLTDDLKVLINQMVGQNKELLTYLSPNSWIDKISNKVFIMHGANDSMVPFTESTLLHQNLSNSTLLISFLYEHKEISTDRGILFKLKEFIKLINFNAKYIRYNL